MKVKTESGGKSVLTLPCGTLEHMPVTWLLSMAHPDQVEVRIRVNTYVNGRAFIRFRLDWIRVNVATDRHTDTHTHTHTHTTD